MRRSRYSTVMRVLLVFVVLAGLINWAADTHDRIEVGLHLGQHSRDPFKIDADTGKIASLMPEAKLAGLVKDATIRSITGSFTWRGIRRG